MNDFDELRQMTVEPGHEEVIEEVQDDAGRVVAVVARVAKCGQPPRSDIEHTADAVVYHLAPGERRDVKERYKSAEGARLRIKLVARSCEEPTGTHTPAGRSATEQASGTIVSAPRTGDSEPGSFEVGLLE